LGLPPPPSARRKWSSSWRSTCRAPGCGPRRRAVVLPTGCPARPHPRRRDLRGTGPVAGRRGACGRPVSNTTAAGRQLPAAFSFARASVTVPGPTRTAIQLRTLSKDHEPELGAIGPGATAEGGLADRSRLRRLACALRPMCPFLKEFVKLRRFPSEFFAYR
jgi:hypothetical protein